MQNFEIVLKNLEWTEGSHIPLDPVTYRHRPVVVCSRHGRQTAQFANGLYPYFTYMELVDEKGGYIRIGGVVVPVLPDGRLILIVEQRPVLSNFGNKRLDQIFPEHSFFGNYNSLEFPGGGIKGGEYITIGCLRELAEETGIAEQKVVVWKRIRSAYPAVADLCHKQYFAVVFLTNINYRDEIPNDGGLKVLALTPEKVRECILTGVIRSHTSLLAWYFYKEVMLAKELGGSLLKEFLAAGYISVSEETVELD